MRDRRRDAPNLEPIAERRERADDIIVEGHMGERPAVFGFETQMLEAHGVAHFPVHDRHREDGLRLRLDRLPGADALEQARRPFGDRDGAQRRCVRAGRRRRIDDRNRDARSHRLLDRSRQGQARSARAGDDDVEDGSQIPARGFFPEATHCRTFGGSAQLGKCRSVGGATLPHPTFARLLYAA